MQPIDSVPLLPDVPATTRAVSPAAPDAKVHATARKFEAMFMTEMLRLARPSPNAAGNFAPSHAEKSWQVFMDQALGDAAVAKGGTGLGLEIEKALRRAQGQNSGGSSK